MDINVCGCVVGDFNVWVCRDWILNACVCAVIDLKAQGRVVSDFLMDF